MNAKLSSMGAAPPLDVPAPNDAAFSETLRLTADSRLVMSTEGNLSPLWTRIEIRQPDGSWQVDPSPGLLIDDAYLDQFRDRLVERMSSAGVLPPPVSLIALARRHEWDARDGKPEALVIARVLEALAFALRDDPEAVSHFHNFAHNYMLQRRPGSVPRGAGDLRNMRSGRPPAAAQRLLDCADTTMRELPPLRREGPTEEEFDRYLTKAETLAWEVADLFPALYPKTPPERERVACALATTLSQMEDRDAERIAMAALRACGMPTKQASNAFNYIDKRKKRAADRQPAPTDHAPR
ncbi:MAG: hypothetical protein Q8S73_39965 [Deltaproteobacteria bacterium]|nr:hypothetical protein [Myxococcales bacterium]MDP3220342.1 hypothetical protein [Deltaproteobacteria bacterium]